MKSPDNWDLQIRGKVARALKRLPHADAERIDEVITLLPLNPYAGDIQKMKGEERVWRRRIGSYRLFYEVFVAEKVIVIFRLERRGSKTY